MPDPGHVRIEAWGEVFETGLLADCSAPAEPPPADQERAQHRFQVNIGWEMDDERLADLSLLRAVALDEALWRSQGHEAESVSLRVSTRGATPERLDERSYSLRRNRPDEPPMVRHNPAERAHPLESADDVPAIRVHPDGRRATFIGTLGAREASGLPGVNKLEEVRIAVHCGPV